MAVAGLQRAIPVADDLEGALARLAGAP
jgi:hypothetical protein